MIAVKLGRAAPEPGSIQEQQWQMDIDDAYMLIENRAEELGVDMATISEMKLDYVVREAVAAYIKRPDDATQVSITVDDGTTSRSYQSGKGRITILDEWWRMLGLVETESGAFSIDMVPSLGSAHLPWCSLAFGASYCSCGVDIAGKPIFELGE
ncbi:Gp19/Gp15/Gp42 family protein [Microbacterium sp. HSID17254]|uniref:Gp19/Gp15/Gp42 family protein n=1 Tax=Microbacterium sp. HSID17254 TaxID=2419509 RepID=UPI00138730C5|nr:Gp19/Gp15/Gp42 family protein [Microbacterium sp. HSID17254]